VPDPINLGLEGNVISKKLGSGLTRPQEPGCDMAKPQELWSSRGVRPRLLRSRR